MPRSCYLVLGAGIIITAPYANFQDFLSQGDHGRDLYAAQAVYRGRTSLQRFLVGVRAFDALLLRPVL